MPSLSLASSLLYANTNFKSDFFPCLCTLFCFQEMVFLLATIVLAPLVACKLHLHMFFFFFFFIEIGTWKSAFAVALSLEPYSHLQYCTQL